MEEWKDIPGYPGFKVSDSGRVLRIGTDKERPPYDKDCLIKPQNTGRHVSLWKPHCSIRITSISIASLVLLAFVGPPPSNMTKALHIDDNCSNNRLENLKWGNDKQNGEDRIKNGKTTRGLVCSDKRRRAISLKLKGRKLSEETCLKMSIARKGRPCSDSQKAAVSKAQKGRAKSLEHKIALMINSGSKKLTTENVIKYRNMYATGKFTYTALAKDAKVSRSTIKDLVLKKTWKHI